MAKPVFHPHLSDRILTLQRYWAGRGCVVLQPYDMEVGAERSTPQRSCGRWVRSRGAAYVQPSRVG